MAKEKKEKKKKTSAVKQNTSGHYVGGCIIIWKFEYLVIANFLEPSFIVTILVIGLAERQTDRPTDGLCNNLYQYTLTLY